MAKWRTTVELTDVWEGFDAENESAFTPTRDTIVTRLRESPWLSQRTFKHGRDDVVVQLVETMSEVDDLEEFNERWDELLTYADLDLVWINTVFPPPK